jgi:hypothetical protein
MGKCADMQIPPIASGFSFKFFPSEHVYIFLPSWPIEPGAYLHICTFAHLLIIQFLPHRFHPFIHQVLIIGHQPVDHALWCKLNNAVGYCLHKLVIMRG